MKFSASFDSTTKWISGVVIIVVIVATTVPLMSVFEKQSGIAFLVLLFALLCVLSTWCFSVKNYEVDQESLIIQKPFSKSSFPLAGIRAISIVEPSSLRWSWRIMGSGGMFGYFGTFANKTYGSMSWYLTRKDKPLVYIQLQNGKKLMLSPVDAEGFIKKLNSILDQ